MASSETSNSTYLEIWKIEQDHSRTRWTVTTFFLSISFLILGNSFDIQETSSATLLSLSLPDIQRIVGVLIFWFGYILFVQFNRYTAVLRNQLRKMEEENLVTLSIQLDADNYMYSKVKAFFSAKYLLLYFGILYSIIVVVVAIISREIP